MLPFPQFIRGYLALKNRFLLTHLRLKVAQVSGLSHSYEAMSDAELQEELASLRDLAQAGSKSEPIEVRAFATIREAARRCVEMYPHEEQLLAALLLNRDKIVQMDTGEGKTLVAPFHAILESLYGR